jgi:hypothetical protein
LGIRIQIGSIPTDEALELLKKWLEEQYLNPNVLPQYLELAKLLMKLNFFQFNGKFYEQTEGTAMGDALSPLLANLYMATFEMVLKRRNLLPKVWVRYVDDIFCVINRRKVSTLLSLLKSLKKKKSWQQLALLGRQSDQKRFETGVRRLQKTYQHSALYPYHVMSSHGTLNGCLPLHVAPCL